MLSKSRFVSTTSAKALVLSGIATLSATAFTAAPASAQAVCTTLPTGVIDCVGADAAGEAGAGLSITNAPEAVVVTLQDGFQSNGTIEVSTLTGDIDVDSVGSALITTEGPGLVLDSASSVTADVTGVSTTGDAATAVFLRAADDVVFSADGVLETAGDGADAVNVVGDALTLDLGTVITQGLDSDGVEVTALDGTIDVEADLIETNGDLSSALILRGTGDVEANVGVLRTAGSEAVGADITTNAAACVLLGAGGCDVTFAANEVSTTGEGAAAVAINSTGNVTTDVGLLSTSGDDAAALTIIADPAACLAIGAGACTVSATADVIETEGADAPGILIFTPDEVTVDAGTVTTAGVNSDGIAVSTGAGSQLITAGTVRVGGLGSDAIAATSVSGDVSITAEDDIVSDLGTGIVADTGGSVDITTLAGADVSGELGGIEATSGLGTALTLGGAVSGGAGPAIDIDGAAADILVGATGMIDGRIDLTDADDTLINDGTFAATGTSDFGAGLDLFTNNGTVSADGAVTFAALETFNNNGLIDMVDGVADDVLTLPGDYNAGAGATLGIDVDAGATGTPADRLVIGGDVTGTTAVDLNFDEPGVVNLDGTVIVDAEAGAGDFVLAEAETAGFVDFSLDRNAAGDTLLLAAPNARAFEVALVPQFGQTFWYRSADAWSTSAAQRRNDLQTGNGRGFGIWGQGYAAQEERGDWQDFDVDGTATRADLRYDTDYRGLQAGIDFRPGAGSMALGVTGGYQKADTDLASGTMVDVRGWNIGGYMLYGAPQGLYAEVLAKVDFFDLDLNNGDLFAGADLDGKSYGAEGEVGFRTQWAGADVDLGAGLAYVKTDIDGFEASNAVFELDDVDSLRGQVGMRISGQSGAFRPFADFRAFHEFLGDNEVRFISGGYTLPLSDRGLGTSGRIEIGVEGPASAGGLFLSTWGELGDTTSYGVRAGVRF